MQTISINYGNAVFSNKSYTMRMFAVKAPFVTTFASKEYKRVSSNRIAVGRTSIEGTIYSEQVEVPDGALLLLSGSQNYYGRRHADASIFLRMRSTAALLSILAKIPHDERSILGGEVSAFMGRADILSAKEAEDMYGIEFRRGYIEQYMDLDEIEECFRIEMLSPEIVPSPKVEVIETQSGEKVTITTPRLSRKMRIRPKD